MTEANDITYNDYFVVYSVGQGSQGSHAVDVVLARSQRKL